MHTFNIMNILVN